MATQGWSRGRGVPRNWSPRGGPGVRKSPRIRSPRGVPGVGDPLGCGRPGVAQGCGLPRMWSPRGGSGVWGFPRMWSPMGWPRGDGFPRIRSPMSGPGVWDSLGFDRPGVAQGWVGCPRMWSPRGRPGVDQSLDSGRRKQAPTCHTTERHRCMVLCEKRLKTPSWEMAWALGLEGLF